jgi:large subunit ribosomal protein L25
MQEDYEIDAVSRDDQGKGASRRLRREGMVPGIIYGGGKDPQMIATKHNELFHRLENQSFYSHILNVKVDGKAQQVVLKDLQRHPSKPFLTHIDFMRVAASDRIKMNVPLHFLNEETAPGVKAGGQVSHLMTDVEVLCAARDLPEYIEVDVGAMELNDLLHLSDIKMPSGVELVAFSHGDDPAEHDASIASVHTARMAGDEIEEEGVAGEAEGEGEAEPEE